MSQKQDNPQVLRAAGASWIIIATFSVDEARLAIVTFFNWDNSQSKMAPTKQRKL